MEKIAICNKISATMLHHCISSAIPQDTVENANFFLTCIGHPVLGDYSFDISNYSLSTLVVSLSGSIVNMNEVLH